MDKLHNAVITKELLKDVVENREYNLIIQQHLGTYLSEIQGKLKIYKDIRWLADALMYEIGNGEPEGDKLVGYVTAIVEMCKANKISIDELDLYEHEDLKKLKNILTIEIDDINGYKIRTISNKIDNVDNCNKYWDIDKFIQHKQKWVTRQNLCHNKFCSNCKKVKQAARMEKYLPELEAFKGKLHHLVLTVPNVTGEELGDTYKKMAKAFKSLVRYISGVKKIKGIDFSSFGYEGALRSLEVTFKNDDYHPHFHVGLVLDQEAIGKKNIENTYSFNYKKNIPELIRLFSEQEILIQKIWRLLIDDKRVNKKNIEELEVGYSCMIDKFKEDDYKELFKYMTKDKDQQGQILTYSNFKALYHGLYRVKQIQGYGVLYRLNDNDLDMEKYEMAYENYIDELIKKESPVNVRQTPQELILDNQYKLLNKKSYIKHLKSL